MSEITTAQTAENIYDNDYVEDEFGVGLKVYLLARLVFGIICLFSTIGIFVCALLGVIIMGNGEHISNFTGLGISYIDANFMGLSVASYAQAAYSLLGTVSCFMLIAKRSKLTAIIDTILFVVFFAVSIVLGGTVLLTDGAPCWFLYIILNPVWSFIALFVGKHFKYMPAK